MKALENPDLTRDQRDLLVTLNGQRKIVINGQHGGFGLSVEAIELYLDLKNINWWTEIDEKSIHWPRSIYWLVPKEQRVNRPDTGTWCAMSMSQRQQYNHLYRQQVFDCCDIDRDDPILVQVVQELGKYANGPHANLKIVEIPADVYWQIDEYDGNEWVAEKHRTWR